MPRHTAALAASIRTLTALAALATANAARIIRTAMRRAGLSGDCSPHGLRRTFVTCGLLQGVALRKMQVAARHANPATTALYDMMSDNLATHASHEVAGYLSSMAGS